MPSDDELVTAQHDVWEAWAQADPMWAILSEPDTTNNRWDVDEFFRTGRAEITKLVEELDDLGFEFQRGRAMDFGCGLGRLSQGLGQYFEHADGVDIADTMIESARKYNQFPDKVAYHLNVAGDLGQFEDGRFDFIYSTMVLQHNPPPAARRYIEEFMRVLKVGGLAVFDMPTQAVYRYLPEDSYRADIKIVAVPDVLAAGQTVRLTVEATNTSGIDWPRGTGLKFGNHWKSVDGEMLTEDDGRAAVSDPVPAGGSLTRQMDITLPAEPGRYVLEVDLVEEVVTWFAVQDNPVASIEVEVTAAAETPADVDSNAEPAMPELFSMNALSQDDVEEAIAIGGGLVLETRDTMRAGADWESLRYAVRRLDPAAAAPRIVEATSRRAALARSTADAAAERLAQAEAEVADARTAAAEATSAADRADRLAAEAEAKAASLS